jgi:hypothetical protein
MSKVLKDFNFEKGIIKNSFDENYNSVIFLTEILKRN